MSKSEENNISRRKYFRIAGGAVAGLVVGGALGYVAKPEVTVPPTTVTNTVTETVTGTVTAPPQTPPRYFNGAKVSTAAIQPFYISPIWTDAGGKTKLCTDFEKEHGIDTSWMSGGEDVMREKIALDVSSGTGLYDLLVHEWLLIPPYSTAGWLEPLEPFVSDPDPEYFTTLDDWLPAWVDSCKYEGVLYGIPTYGSGGGYTFNKDYLLRYGGWDKPPDTFEELNACCADLKDGFKKAGKDKEIYPMVMQCKKGEEPSNNIVGVAWAYGGRMFEGGVDRKSVV
jgi:ABC-type glycerol-3-phosphate transport system substrate-binding protein